MTDSAEARDPLETVDRFPRDVIEVENAWIELADGCRLAARLWRPRDAESDPVPAILEYLPYRKRDGTAERDARTHPYLAGHGYACIRVDLRGNGESDGLMWDEYLPQEQEDALEVIEWIARQPWCDGRVGMMGISWGGFNALQVAARRPKALKAIITLCSTDDRYADDIHYKGGAMLLENLGWASTMLAYSSRPPDPALVGEAWREMWMQRLENTPLLLDNWLRHQRRDAYWRHGSVCEDFSAIEIPVLAVGGWGDAYSNAVPRLLRGLTSPTRGIVGPWVHKYPHIAVPGPLIHFLGEALRWWDRWLKGIDTGVERDPSLTVYMMESVRPAAMYEHRPGRWLAEEVWPSPSVRPRQWFLNASGLSPTRGPETPLRVSSPQSTGTASGEYCAIWLGPDWPTDQRVDDAGSLAFDSPPLERGIEILGAPTIELDLSIDKTRGLIAVRLCDVWPEGESTRITYGVLNLCHREGHESPVATEPGVRYRVKLLLDDVAYSVPAGHRLRIAVSTSYWPLIWPSPEKTVLTVYAGAGRLELPERLGPDRPRSFAPAQAAPALGRDIIGAPSHRRTLERDLASGRCVVRIEDDFGTARIHGHGLVAGSIAREVYTIEDHDPLSCEARTHWTMTLRRDVFDVRIETRQRLWSDRESFFVEAGIEAFEGERLVFSRSFERKVARDFL